MELKNKAMRCLGCMDEIIVHPRFTAGISVQNKRTGKLSGNRSITVSKSTTLLRMILFLIAICLAMKAFFCLCRMKRERILRKKYRNKLKKACKK